jgi:hypothetical protein
MCEVSRHGKIVQRIAFHVKTWNAVVCCFRYWEEGSSGEGEFFDIYIFISVIGAQLVFVSFRNGPLRHAYLHAEETAGGIGRCPTVREVFLALDGIDALVLRAVLVEVRQR